MSADRRIVWASPAEERELARVQAKFPLTEKDWQRQVVALARLCGWRPFHALSAKGSEPGFPDLVLVRPPRLVFAELKTDQGRVRPPQREWLADLERVAAAAPGVVTAGLWRPGDLTRIDQLLRQRMS